MTTWHAQFNQRRHSRWAKGPKNAFLWHLIYPKGVSGAPRSSAEPEAVGQRPDACIDLACDTEQPLEIPKPKKKGRPAGTKDTYKRTRNTKTNHTPMLASVADPMPAKRSFPQGNAAVERYDRPCYRGPLGQGVDMNTLAYLMLDRMTLRSSDARSQRTQRWDTNMPHS